MFRASSTHLQEDTVVHMQHMVLSLSMRVLTQAVYRQHLPIGFITEMECVYCAVRTGYLNVTVINCRP